METMIASITICFEAPFWVGIYERQIQNQYCVCKIVFGAEPKDYTVYEYLQNHWQQLRFSPSITVGKLQKTYANPKRMQRAIQKQTQTNPHIGTKAQQAYQLLYQQQKQLKNRTKKLHRQQQKQRQFILRQQKQKEKHKGHLPSVYKAVF